MLRPLAASLAIVALVGCRGREPGSGEGEGEGQAEGEGDAGAGEGEGEPPPPPLSPRDVLSVCAPSGAGLALRLRQDTSVAADGTLTLHIAFDGRDTQGCTLDVQHGLDARHFVLPAARVQSDVVLDVSSGGTAVSVALRCETQRGAIEVARSGDIVLVDVDVSRDGDEADVCWDSSGDGGCSAFFFGALGIGTAEALPPSSCIRGSVAQAIGPGDYHSISCGGAFGSGRTFVPAQPPTPAPPPGLAIDTFEVRALDSESLLVAFDGHGADACSLVIDGRDGALAVADPVAFGRLTLDVDWAVVRAVDATLTCRRGDEAVVERQHVSPPRITSLRAAKPDPLPGEIVEVCFTAINVDVCAPTIEHTGCGANAAAACCDVTVPEPGAELTSPPLLACRGPGGDVTLPLPFRTSPGIVSLSADPRRVAVRGGLTTVSWATAQLASCELLDQQDRVVGSGENGAAEVAIDASQDFVLRCRSNAGDVVEEALKVEGEHRFDRGLGGFARIFGDDRAATGTTACAFFDDDVFVGCAPLSADDDARRRVQAPDPAVDRRFSCAAPDGNEVERAVSVIRSFAARDIVEGGVVVAARACVDAAGVTSCRIDGTAVDDEGCVLRPPSAAVFEARCDAVVGVAGDELVASIGYVPGPHIDGFEAVGALPPGGGDAWVLWSSHGSEACALSVGGAVIDVEPVGYRAFPLTETTEVEVACPPADPVHATLRVGATLDVRSVSATTIEWVASFVDTCTLDYVDFGGTARHVTAAAQASYADSAGIVAPRITCTGPNGTITAP